MIGQKISHYEILEKLGEGGMGIVYKAQDTKLKRTVALKFLPPQTLASEADKTRFLHEAQAAAALDHPNIGTIHEIDEADGRPFIVMAYIDGQTLKHKIEAGPVAVDEALAIAIHVAQGLQAAHEKGIVHRDIKSANIMITSKSQAKIMDFGLAKLTGRTQLTKMGATVGTVAYMSPEQARSEAVDHHTDIWSFGVVFYEMLAGQLPFQSQYEQALVYCILNETPKAVSTLRAEVSPELEAIVAKCLEKEAPKRYQDANDLLADLYRLKGTAPPAEVTWKLIRKKVRPFLLPAIALFVLSSAGLGYFFFRGSLSGNGRAEAPENSLAVMYFENQSGEKDLDKVLITMLYTNLARDKNLEILSDQRRFDILKLLGKQDVETIDRSLAAEVAHRAHVKTMLVGSIIKLGSKLRITTQLLDVNSGNIIGSDQADGSKVEDIYDMVDELTQKVQENFHLPSVGAGNQPLKIRDVTTSSLDAYTHYQKGLEHLWRWELDDAAKDFERAVAIDSTFAMAYLRLAISKATNSTRIRDFKFDLAPVRESLKRAKTFSVEATDRERSFIDVNIALFDRHLNEAESLAVGFAQKYPDDREANSQLMRTSWFLGKSDQVIQAAERTLEIDPTYVMAYGHLAYTYSIQGDQQKAISSIKKLLALQPHSYDSAVEVYLQMGLLEEAWRICEAWENFDPSDTHPQFYMGLILFFRADGEKAREEYRSVLTRDPKLEDFIKLNIACSFISEGRYKEAVTEFKKRVELAERAKDARREILSRFDLGKTFLSQGNCVEALEQFSAAENVSTKIYHESFNPMLPISGYLSGLALVKKGNYREALHTAERIRQLIEKNHYDSPFLDFYQMLYGELSLARGDAQAAATAVTKLSPLTATYPRRQSLVAAVEAANGSDQEAITTYNRFQTAVIYRNSYSGGDYFDYFLERSRLNYNLAKIYDRKGNKSKAIEYYSKALDQWKRADNDLPELIETKTRLERLKK